MKINIFKAIIVFAISAIIGLICYSIADQEGSRNIISLAVTTVTMFLGLGAATAVDYNCGHRQINIKTTAWLFTFVILLLNIIFSCFTYNAVMYAAIVLLVSLIDIALIYSINKPQE